MVIGTLAVDGWAVTFCTARRGLSGATHSITYVIHVVLYKSFTYLNQTKTEPNCSFWFKKTETEPSI